MTTVGTFVNKWQQANGGQTSKRVMDHMLSDLTDSTKRYTHTSTKNTFTLKSEDGETITGHLLKNKRVVVSTDNGTPTDYTDDRQYDSLAFGSTSYQILDADGKRIKYVNVTRGTSTSGSAHTSHSSHHDDDHSYAEGRDHHAHGHTHGHHHETHGDGERYVRGSYDLNYDRDNGYSGRGEFEFNGLDYNPFERGEFNNPGFGGHHTLGGHRTYSSLESPRHNHGHNNFGRLPNYESEPQHGHPDGYGGIDIHGWPPRRDGVLPVYDNPGPHTHRGDWRSSNNADPFARHQPNEYRISGQTLADAETVLIRSYNVLTQTYNMDQRDARALSLGLAIDAADNTLGGGQNEQVAETVLVHLSDDHGLNVFRQDPRTGRQYAEVADTSYLSRGQLDTIKNAIGYNSNYDADWRKEHGGRTNDNTYLARHGHDGHSNHHNDHAHQGHALFFDDHHA